MEWQNQGDYTVFVLDNTSIGLLAMIIWSVGIIILNIIIASLRVFHTIVNWWFLTKLVVTSHLKSPGFFSVPWPILIMLKFGWSTLTVLFPNIPFSLQISLRLFKANQVNLVSSSSSCSFFFHLPKFWYLSLFLLSRRCPWCNGYRHRIWTRRYEFNSWTRLIAFHIALIPMWKLRIQLFSLQLWVNSRVD